MRLEYQRRRDSPQSGDDWEDQGKTVIEGKS